MVNQVSRYFATVTHDRTLWLLVLRRISERFAVVPGTYPIEQMTLNELEHAATSSSRLVHMLRTGLNPDQSLHPLASWSTCNDPNMIVSRLNSLGHRSGAVASMVLLPGGRYLVTRTEMRILRMWDLGHVSQVNTKASCIAVMKTPGEAGKTHCRPIYF